MEWYYAEAGQQKGPVSESDFDGLVKAGTVRPDTLVWREGMTGWQPHGTVAGGAVPVAGAATGGGIVCSQCGQAFPPDQVIRYADAWVCAGCKPIFLQRLKEGVATLGALEYATFWTRFAAKFVDGIILWIVNMAISLVIGFGVAAGASSTPEMAMVVQLLLVLFSVVLNLLYTIFFLGRFGATPGKMACKIVVVNPDGSAIGYGKATSRCLAEILSGLLCYVGYIMAGFDEERRALHDRLAGTRVIKR